MEMYYVSLEILKNKLLIYFFFFFFNLGVLTNCEYGKSKEREPSLRTYPAQFIVTETNLSYCILIPVLKAYAS